MGGTLVAGDLEDAVENSEEFLSQIEQLNESWYVFAGLALAFALGAFYIHRNLQRQQSLKVDFSAPQPNASDDLEARHSYRSNKTDHGKQKANGSESDNLVGSYGRLPDRMDKEFLPNGGQNLQAKHVTSEFAMHSKSKQTANSLE